jgi:hypothetical protein
MKRNLLMIPVLCLICFGVSLPAFSAEVPSHRADSRHECRELCGDAGVKSGEWVRSSKQSGCWHQEGHFDCVCNEAKQ